MNSEKYYISEYIIHTRFTSSMILKNYNVEYNFL